MPGCEINCWQSEDTAQFPQVCELAEYGQPWFFTATLTLTAHRSELIVPRSCRVLVLDRFVNDGLICANRGPDVPTRYPTLEPPMIMPREKADCQR